MPFIQAQEFHIKYSLNASHSTFKEIKIYQMGKPSESFTLLTVYKQPYLFFCSKDAH